MSTTKELNATLRTRSTKKETERVRKEGYLPGILYGHGVKPIMLSVKQNEFVKLMHEIGTSSLITLKSDSKDLNGVTTVVKDIQYHVVKDSILHIDFQAIKKGEEIKVTVPLNFTGDPVGVKEGGQLQTHVTELNISCKPKDMPSEITVDITELKVGDMLHVRDLSLDKNIKVLDSEDEILVSVQEAKGISVSAPEEEAQETAITEEETQADTQE